MYFRAHNIQQEKDLQKILTMYYGVHSIQKEEDCDSSTKEVALKYRKIFPLCVSGWCLTLTVKDSTCQDHRAGSK